MRRRRVDRPQTTSSRGLRDVQEVELFAEYLHRLREEKLKASHAVLLGGESVDNLHLARVHAFEAETIKRIAEALKVLDKDVTRFVKEFLQ